MCPGATYRSHDRRICFAVNRHDAAGIEFRDEFIHGGLAKPVNRPALPMEYLPCDGAREVFARWNHLAGRVTC